MRIPEPLARWHRHGHLWQRIAATAFAIAALVLIASSDVLHAALVGLFEAADRAIGAHPVAGAALFVLFSGGSAMLAFFSSSLLVPAAIVAWGRTAAALLLWLGWILGGVVSYALARRLGRPVVALLGAAAPLAAWEERISRRAPLSVALLFQLAVPSEVPGFVLGMVRYPFRRYLAVVALGELPFAIGTVFVGASFLERRTPLLVALGAAGIGISLLAFRVLQGRLRGEHPGGASSG
jgi:uncharacterized membrane protein YdjX (TVP38/TMEM64 family)